MSTRRSHWKRTILTSLVIMAGLGLLTPHAHGGDKANFGSKQRVENGFTGEIFQINTGTRKLAQVKWTNPVGTIYARELYVPKTDFREGFPGISDRFEWFAIRYKARFRVLDEGTYRFKLRSDDGSRLYVDGKEVVDNDGDHAAKTKTGKVRLSPGMHDIQVDYFQGPRYSVALELWIDPPYGDAVIFRPDLPVGRGDGPFGSIFGNQRMFAGQLFAVDRGFRVEDMNRMGRPLGTIYTDQLNVSDMRWHGGFPFITDRADWFAIRYTAEFSVPVAGSYGFSLRADDGAMLYIDGRLVVDNGGMHAPKTRSRSIELMPGDHTIRVDYFQGDDRVALKLEITSPFGTESTFVPGMLTVTPPPAVTGMVGTSVTAGTGAMLLTAQSKIDFVSQAAVFAPDGFPDAHIQLSVPVPAGTIQSVELVNTDGFPSQWNTIPGSNGWALAVVQNGLRQNRPDGSISIYHPGGTLALDLYVQDNGSISAGLTQYRLDLTLSDGNRFSLPVIRP